MALYVYYVVSSIFFEENNNRLQTHVYVPSAYGQSKKGQKNISVSTFVPLLHCEHARILWIK